MTSRFKNKFNQLDELLHRLLKDLEHYTEAKLNEKPDEKAWSVFQVMHYLMLTEDLSSRYIEKKLSFNPELEKASIKTMFREWLLIFYMIQPFKIKAPTAVSQTLPNYSQFWDTARQWKQQRMAQRDFYKNLPPDLFKQEIYKHPVAGRVTLNGMVRFQKIHFKRHRKQIFRTLKAVDALKQN